VIARGRFRVSDMNTTEAQYSQELDLRLRAGEIAWYRFEGVTLKLADDTRYTPDFLVMLASGELECHEVKGTTTKTSSSGIKYKAPYCRDDAKVKIKVAAAAFPFRFKLLFLVNGAWQEEEI